MRDALVKKPGWFIASAVVLVVASVCAMATAQDTAATNDSAAADSFPSVSGGTTDSAAAADNHAPAGTRARFSGNRLVQLYLKGGVFMHPLLLCLIIGLVLSIERAWALSRARSNTKKLMLDVVRALRAEGPQAALEVCQGTRGPIAAVLHAGLLRAHRGAEAVEKAIATSGAIEMAFLQRGLTLLVSVSTVAPLLGFLGTVSGMIRAFAAISGAEQVSAGLVAKGIEEALIATAAGLLIAVPVSIFYRFFVMSIDRFIVEMEEASTELVDELLDIEHKRGGIA